MALTSGELCDDFAGHPRQFGGGKESPALTKPKSGTTMPEYLTEIDLHDDG